MIISSLYVNTLLGDTVNTDATDFTISSNLTESSTNSSISDQDEEIEKV